MVFNMSFQLPRPVLFALTSTMDLSTLISPRMGPLGKSQILTRPPALTQKLATKTQSPPTVYTLDGSVRKPPRSARVGAIARPRARGFESADMRITISIANAYRFLTMCLRFVSLNFIPFHVKFFEFNYESRFCFLL